MIRSVNGQTQLLFSLCNDDVLYKTGTHKKMDHVDIAASPELSVSGPVTLLHVRIPFSADAQNPQPAGKQRGNSGLAAQQAQYPCTRQNSIAKPTLARDISLAPIEKWIPDSQVAACMAPECQLQFTLFNRKHHCRACGRIFCANCSSHNIQDTTARSKGSSLRICSECFYEHQLVVVRRPNDGALRRRTRGELKMFQWPLIVRILCYLPLSELLNVSAVSSDLYFMSRDNAVWFVHNMNRWGSDMSQEKSSNMLQSDVGSAEITTPVIGSAGKANRNSAAVGGRLSKTVISHHARYNFTQFLDFARRLESARCQGLSSFSAGAKQLLSSPIKICVVGPPGVGKTFFVKRFVGEITGDPVQIAAQASTIHSTCGFATYTKRVSIVGGLTCDAVMTIVDVAGDKRYEQLRVLCAQGAHAIVVCYNSHSKMSLVHAANLMTGIEPHLGPQPAIVCGVIHDPHLKRDVSAVGAEGITVRCRASIQTSSADELFETVIQTLLDRLVLGTSVVSPSSPAASSPMASSAARTAAQDLLSISVNPSVLDVLLDSK